MRGKGVNYDVGFMPGNRSPTPARLSSRPRSGSSPANWAARRVRRHHRQAGNGGGRAHRQRLAATDKYGFGREPHGTPAAPWGWDALNTRCVVSPRSLRRNASHIVNWVSCTTSLPLDPKLPRTVLKPAGRPIRGNGPPAGERGFRPPHPGGVARRPVPISRRRGMATDRDLNGPGAGELPRPPTGTPPPARPGGSGTDSEVRRRTRSSH
jgi:hypothetical protein